MRLRKVADLSVKGSKSAGIQKTPLLKNAIGEWPDPHMRMPPLFTK